MKVRWPALAYCNGYAGEFRTRHRAWTDTAVRECPKLYKRVRGCERRSTLSPTVTMQGGDHGRARPANRGSRPISRTFDRPIPRLPIIAIYNRHHGLSPGRHLSTGKFRRSRM